MKACEYCGRESVDEAPNCHECGTSFPLPPIAPIAITELPTKSFIDLDKVENSFDFSEGFSRPDWKLIENEIKSRLDPEDWPAAWDEVVIQWLARLQRELGRMYVLTLERDFVMLSTLESATAKRILKFADGAIFSIRSALGTAIPRSSRRLGVLMLFEEEDDYYQYISHFYQTGTHPKSGGVHIKSGYPHTAMTFVTELFAVQVIAHELAHNALNCLSIPLWLNEGVAQQLENLLPDYTRSKPIVTVEMAQRHRQYWDEQRIQQFWAGTSFHIPGDSVELSYSLALILIQPLLKDRSQFHAFLSAASRDDAGQTAALDCLGFSLEDVVTAFLGDGNWRPQRKTIKACWEAERSSGK